MFCPASQSVISASSSGRIGAGAAPFDSKGAVFDLSDSVLTSLPPHALVLRRELPQWYYAPSDPNRARQVGKASWDKRMAARLLATRRCIVFTPYGPKVTWRRSLTSA